MFYGFRQNNSGGRFIIDETAGLTVMVIIEADSSKQANEIAKRKGIYFDGCSTGQDCSCCGNRWYRNADDGDQEPMYYDVPVAEAKNLCIWAPEGKEIAVHYKNGRILWHRVRVRVTK